MRSGACMVVLFVCALPAQHEAPGGLRTPEEMLAALAGTDATRAAWAAHLLRYRRDGASYVKQLRESLQQWGGADASSREAKLHVLDALIGLNASVPATYVLPLLDDPLCGVAAFVLLAKEPRHNEKELLDLFQLELRRTRRDKPLSPRAAAIGSLLAEQRTPGFAKSLVDRVDTSARVEVGNGGVQRQVFFSAARDDAPELAESMPPRPHYAFARSDVQVQFRPVVPVESPLNGMVVRGEIIAGGVRVVPGRPLPEQAPEMDYLRWLARMSRHDAPPHAATIQYRDDATFIAEVTAARDERQRWFEGLRVRLVATEVLSEDDVKALARPVELVVVDRRSRRGNALPSIPAK